MRSLRALVRVLAGIFLFCLVPGWPAGAGPVPTRAGVAAPPAGMPAAAVPGRDYVPGRVLVGLRADAVSRPEAVVSNLQALLPGKVRRHLKHTARQHVVLMDLPPGQTVEQALREDWRKRDPRIEYVEPDYLFQLQDLPAPNDPRFSEQWSLHEVPALAVPAADIDAASAWQVQRFLAPQVIVAVVDSGIDCHHPDLVGNLWTNPGEIAGNGIDDDGNGYVDDIHGYNWTGNFPGDVPNNDPLDMLGHGTHCAGIIGAVGDNGIGICGVAWSAKIMALRIGGADRTISLSAAVPAIEYAIANGAKVISASWGGPFGTSALYDALVDARDAGVLFVAAAGNSSPTGTDRDLSPMYPACYDLDNIISVASIDYNGQLSWFSDYGRNAVDLAAPGSGTRSGDPVQILSTYPGFVTLFSEDFEQVAVPASGVTADTGSQLIKAGPNNCWGTLLEDGNKAATADWRAYGPYTGFMVSEGSLRTPEYDTTVYRGVRLKFMYRMPSGAQRLTVRVGDGSGAWTEVPCTFNANNRWHEMDLDLRHYSNPHLSVDFYWYAPTHGSDVGARIDDISLDVIGEDFADAYRQFSGTSMATPHVSGAAALVLSRYPGMTCQDVKQRLIKTVDLLPSLAGKCVSGGRLNLFAALAPVRNVTRGTWHTAIQDAISGAVSGDEIVVSPGTYHENVVVAAPLTLRSVNPDDPETVSLTVIQAAAGSDSLALAAGSVVRGLTIQGGNGIACGDNVTIGKCVVSGSAGSGIRQGGGLLSECAIRDNAGGGVVSFAGAIRRCTITGNHAPSSGAGLRDCAATIEACLVAGNAAGGPGGGLAGVSGAVRSCLLVGNTSAAAGGAVYASAAAPLMLANCTIVANRADGPGAGVATTAGATLVNCILRDNTAAASGAQLAVLAGAAGVSYTNLQAGQTAVHVETGAALAWGPGNTDADPLFAGAAGPDGDPAAWADNDYHLFAGSPCIDAGDPAGDYTGQVDMDAQPRIHLTAAGGTVDMGAFEYARDVIRVGPGQTIADAIARASSGDEIVIEDGTYTGEGNYNLDLADKNLFVHSANGPAGCIIDCQTKGRGFYIHGGQDDRTIIEGLTILNGSPPHVGTQSTSGGGIYCLQASPTIRDCVIRGCNATLGGGINLSGSSATISGCVIAANRCGNAGAGIMATGTGSPRIIRCRIVSNTLTSINSIYGGGLYLGSSGVTLVDTCVIAGNDAARGGSGGGAYCFNATVVFSNCTIVNNLCYRGTWGGPGLSIFQSDATVSNCILRGNIAKDMYGSEPRQIGASGTLGIFHLRVRYSDVQGGIPTTVINLGGGSTFDWGPGNVDADPLFVDPSGTDADPGNDFWLGAGSPCIDAGDPAGDYTGLLSWQGQPRVVGAAVDIGADEYVPALLASDPPAGGTLCRTTDNQVRLVFAAPVVLPVGTAPVSIRPRLSTSPLQLGDDLAGRFTFQLAATHQPDDTLVIRESGQVFEDLAWYRIEPAASLLVADYKLDVCAVAGDINGDAGIDVVDLLCLVDSWSKAVGDPAYDPRCDFNADGAVDILDLLILVDHWPQ